MRILVCGGRDYRNAAFVWRTLDDIHGQRPIAALIQGGATGADKLAKEWAMTKPEVERYESRAKWDDLSHPDAVIRARADGSKYDAKAGHRRNAHMLTWKPDMIVAFPGGSGTADMIDQARKAGVTVYHAQTGEVEKRASETA